MALNFNQAPRFNRREAPVTKPDRAFEIASRNLDAHRVDMRKFIPKYTLEGVLEDVMEVNRLLRMYDEDLAQMELDDQRYFQRMKKESVKCEWAIFSHIHIHKALGENVDGRVASHFDDKKRKVDQYYQFLGEEGDATPFAFNIDVTFSRNSIGDKYEDIKHDIEAGRLSSIKYCENADGSPRDELHDVPRLIVGFDNERIERISHLWAIGDERSPEAAFIQDGLLSEVGMELKTFRDFAHKIGQNKIADIYDRNLHLFDGVAKRASREISSTRFEEDKVFRTLGQNLSLFR